MILKDIDDKSIEFKMLSNLYNRAKNQKTKDAISKELNMLKAGYEAEKENAFYLSARLSEDKKLLLINDIRIKHNGLVAQIDHIIISRQGIEILESKSSRGTMTINLDGSIIVKNRNGNTITLPNPLEQAYRQAEILKSFLRSKELLPKRSKLFGGTELNIRSGVLINPKTTLTNQTLPDGFYRADSFITLRKRELDSMSLASGLKATFTSYSMDEAYLIANVIINAHEPITFDYEKKFKMNENFK